MKTLLISLLLLGTTATFANASVKHTHHMRHYTDHSKDIAYSAAWANKAQAPARNAYFSMNNESARAHFEATHTIHYNASGFVAPAAPRPTMHAPYDGLNAPSWEGPALNDNHNLRAYKTKLMTPPDANSIGRE